MYMLTILAIVGSQLVSPTVVNAPVSLSACNAAIENLAREQGVRTQYVYNSGAKYIVVKKDGVAVYAACSLIAN